MEYWSKPPLQHSILQYPIQFCLFVIARVNCNHLSSAFSYSALVMKRNIITVYSPPSAGNFPPGFIDKQGYWVGFYLVPYAITYNTKLVPKAELLETCFKYVERIAHVPPETVKINLHISTQGLEMMGLRKAWTLNAELAAMPGRR